ncbi:insecticidal delta-endotoxin Cry8Ea1 family protein [Vallitalea guaymasensis]|uniref:insecticidal delta-endotoxin Cry8Ea1 family protein n=1 Tax=Vallitalea guaymasensis TaxID=1185412 RepID=UPI002355FDDD|nr:insecticidal delta-endotoxin Cry8Ea1 family protein [Vallitalea guaymasensis]
MKKNVRKRIVSFILITIMLVQILTFSVIATQTNDVFENLYSYTRARVFQLSTEDLIRVLETDNYLDINYILADDPGFDLIPGIDLPIEDGITAMKGAITGSIGCIPVVGALVSNTVGLFFPDSLPELEADIKKEICDIIDYEFSKDTLRVLSSNMLGILNNADRYKESMVLYLKYLQNPTDDSVDILKSELRSSADEYLSNLEQYIPNFKKEGYRVVSLPLFTLMANLHLTLLRDLALNGEEWGYSNAKVEVYTQDIINKVEEYRQYVQMIYKQGLNERYKDDVMTDFPSRYGVHDLGPGKNVATYRWNYINDYKRYMRMYVLDLASLWTYYDIEVYPDYVNFEQVEHIYSSIVGRAGITEDITYSNISFNQKMKQKPVTVGYKYYDSTNKSSIIDLSTIEASKYNVLDYTMGMDLQSEGRVRDIDSITTYVGNIKVTDGTSFNVPVSYAVNGNQFHSFNDIEQWEFSYEGYRVNEMHIIDTICKPEKSDFSSLIGYVLGIRDTNCKPVGLDHSILGVVFEFRPKYSNYENLVLKDRITVIPAEKYNESTQHQQFEEVILGGDSIKIDTLAYEIYSPVKGDFQIRYRISSGNSQIATQQYNFDTEAYENIETTTLTKPQEGFTTDNGIYVLYDVGKVTLKKGINKIKINLLSGDIPLLSSIEFKPITIYEDETLDYDYIQPKDPCIITETTGVNIYPETNYQGLPLYRGIQKFENIDAISYFDFKSIKFDGDYKVRAFENRYYTGKSYDFTASNPNVNIGEIHSIKVVKGGDEGVYLYSEKNYGGTETKVSFDSCNSNAMGVINDSVSSIKIVGNYVVQAFQHEHYGGEHSELQESDSDLSDNTVGDNQISSIKITKVDPVRLQEGVFIYKDEFYQGECSRLVSGDYGTFYDLGLENDSISSIKIVGDYQVEAYSDNYYEGKSQVFKASDRNLYDDFIGNNNISSLKIRAKAPETTQ